MATQAMTLSDYSRTAQAERRQFKKAVLIVRRSFSHVSHFGFLVVDELETSNSKLASELHFTIHGCRERRTGKSAPLGKEAVLAASGRVRRAHSSTAC